MSFRTWLYVFAFGIAIASSVQAQEQTQSAEENPTIQSGPAEPNSVGIPVRIIEDSISADAREQSEREASEREEDDLVAQERMADATEAMNEATQSMKNAAWWSFGAVAIGTLLLAYTLKLTRAATKSAQSAVTVTRDIGEAQSRAYLSVQDIEITQLTGKSSALVKFQIRNTGMTPARNIVWCGNAFVSDTFLRNEKAESESLAPGLYRSEIGGQSKKPAEITATGVRNMNTLVTSDHIRKITNRQSHLFCLIEIFYSDVFDGRYKINATYRLDEDSLKADGSGRFLMAEFSEEEVTKDS